MTAHEKIELVLEATQKGMADNPDMELHISPLIYIELILQNKVEGQGIIETFKGYPLVIQGMAPKDWIMAKVK